MPGHYFPQLIYTILRHRMLMSLQCGYGMMRGSLMSLWDKIKRTFHDDENVQIVKLAFTKDFWKEGAGLPEFAKSQKESWTSLAEKLHLKKKKGDNAK